MKGELVKTIMLALLFSLLVSTYVISNCFGIYPGPDEDETEGRGAVEGVTATAIGWYYEENHNVYEDVGHGSSRWAKWPSDYYGNMICRYRTSEYDLGEYEFGEGENYYSCIGYDIYASWVESYTYSQFTNGLGGTWSHSTTAYVHAYPF